MDFEEAATVARIAAEPGFRKYLRPYFENRKETLIRDVVRNDNRDYAAGQLKEILDFLCWIEQHEKDYIELKGEKK